MQRHSDWLNGEIQWRENNRNIPGIVLHAVFLNIYLIDSDKFYLVGRQNANSEKDFEFF